MAPLASFACVFHFLLSVAGHDALAVTTPDKSSKDYSYEIKSSEKVPGLSVLREGSKATAAVGTLPGIAGLNEIMISAPDYAARKIRFRLEAGKKLTVSVNLLKLAKEADRTLEWKSPLKKFDAQKLAKIASVCAWYQNKAQDKASCDRETILDDLFYADDSVFRGDETRDYERDGELNTFKNLLVNFDKASASQAIEDFYARHPGKSSAYHLLSLNSLLLGDCPRVHDVYSDAKQNITPINFLRLHLAVCAEAQNNTKLRDQIVAAGLKGSNAEPSLAYWAFQIQVPLDLSKASELAVICSKSKTYDLRCQDAMAMVAKLQDKPYRISKAPMEEVTFKNFLAIEDLIPKGQTATLYSTIAAQLEIYPLSIENYLFMSWIDSASSKDSPPNAYLERRMEVSSVMAGGTLDKIVEAIEKDDRTKLLPPVYLRRLHFNPADPNLWYRLIRSFAKAKQCEPLLSAVEKGKEHLPKYNTSLLQMRGTCELDLGRLKEALVTYSKIMEVNPRVWSSPYNLATVYERLGKKKEAHLYYKQTLALKPPTDVADTVKTKVDQLQTSIK